MSGQGASPARAPRAHVGARASMLDGSPRGSHGPLILAGVGAALLHSALALGAGLMARLPEESGVAKSASVSQWVEVELPPPPAPPPPVEEPRAEPVRVKAAPAARTPAPRTTNAPPPAAAQAAQVATAAPEVADFGDTFVVGKGSSYAGGTTESGGTATHAVRDANARAGGVEGGTGTDLAGDRSRRPALAGGARWDCPFPGEADDAGIDHGVVTLRVEVDAEGSVLSAAVTSDPGHGFGREARRCALSKRWSPGLDRAGQPTRAVALVNVRFAR
ncbi:energy transducer TonB [Pyxidicoccus parkwayensis]|uniref:Energy transducer TonB n=1 Tax=Pyxidicoccus parkwayensis TaxID=2813578 RepID=A0ABX7NPT5_9BACT|nr:energy transducer TonB [Pyxidicoccus parkwaysis]QSQ19459.1 energy transducer TonB [Pyxidicoccus parkwaysis]